MRHKLSKNVSDNPQNYVYYMFVQYKYVRKKTVYAFFRDCAVGFVKKSHFGFLFSSLSLLRPARISKSHFTAKRQVYTFK
jgi:hypothetical protein